jgi:hypothetical protein
VFSELYPGFGLGWVLSVQHGYAHFCRDKNLIYILLVG